MCGIFAYYNYRVPRTLQEVLDALFQGLRRLEYRGYDSAGLCVDADDSAALKAWPAAAAANGSHGGGGGGGGAVANGSSETGPRPVSPLDPSTTPHVIKAVGNIAALEALAAEYIATAALDTKRELQHHVGVAHTRWATHGRPTPANSHPHVSDPAAEFVVVHNGIITNHTALRGFLSAHGETFVSETDTEVIPKLCRYVYRELGAKVPFPKLVIHVMRRLEGAFALVLKSRHYPGELVACRRGSPLIAGVRVPGGLGRLSSFRAASALDGGADDGFAPAARADAIEVWCASDASAVVEHTKKVIVLEDDDVLHVAGGGYGVYSASAAAADGANGGGAANGNGVSTGGGSNGGGGAAVERVLQTLAVEVDQIMKGGYDHYMQKEIHEQPEALLQTMRGRVLFRRPEAGPGPYDPAAPGRVKLGGLAEYRPAIRTGRRIVFVACGTSFHACLAARGTVEELVGLPVALELASDLLDRRPPIFRDDTCVFVSQSGETADTLRALDYAKAKGALCVGVTNTVGSALSRATHCGVHQNAGYEIGVASTKAYTSQILCVAMMALALAEDSRATAALREEIADAMGDLEGHLKQVLRLDGAMRELAAQLRSATSLLFFARGANYATALEAALKMKEVALIHSEGILAGEMKHGPLALVDEHMPIVVVATRDATYQKMTSVVEQLLARGAKLVILCNEGDQTMRNYAAAHGCRLIEVPRTADALQPVVNIVPLQLLAYHATVLRGFNVDQPRNLAKSVTVTD